MSSSHHEQQPVISHVEPVLSVVNVSETIQYWREVLGFPGHWYYGDPPNHGGVSWHGAFVQFHQDAGRAKTSAGNVVWIRVKYITQLYKIHQQLKANIVDELQSRPWGLDEYWVRDINGYNIIFSGNTGDRVKSLTYPESVVIKERNPTREEFIALNYSVGWTNSLNMAMLDNHLSAPVYSVVAIDTASNETIGCALLIGDNSSFYYIKDVMVKKEWQGKRIGTALMKSIADWLDKNGIKKSLVGLYTGENLEPFYGQFGFEKAFGMVKRL
jgi:GNAT superfamily N-acetyltransferase